MHGTDKNWKWSSSSSSSLSCCCCCCSCIQHSLSWVGYILLFGILPTFHKSKRYNCRILADSSNVVFWSWTGVLQENNVAWNNKNPMAKSQWSWAEEYTQACIGCDEVICNHHVVIVNNAGLDCWEQPLVTVEDTFRVVKWLRVVCTASGVHGVHSTVLFQQLSQQTHCIHWTTDSNDGAGAEWGKRKGEETEVGGVVLTCVTCISVLMCASVCCPPPCFLARPSLFGFVPVQVPIGDWEVYLEVKYSSSLYGAAALWAGDKFGLFLPDKCV